MPIEKYPSYPCYRAVYNPTPEVRFFDEPDIDVFVAKFDDVDLAMEYADFKNSQIEQ